MGRQVLMLVTELVSLNTTNIKVSFVRYLKVAPKLLRTAQPLIDDPHLLLWLCCWCVPFTLEVILHS